MMSKFIPSLLLDEQMIFHDTRNTLLYQIREELRTMNKNLESLNKPPELKIEQKTIIKKPVKEVKKDGGKLSKS